jgi:two-component system response regulator VicR
MTRRILVIDDDPDVIAILKMTLERAGYDVTAAASGREGLERVIDCYPDLILLDVMMPVMDGWQVCYRLREITEAPIIMLTVLGKEQSVVKGLHLGADDYIAKPWSNRELLARIRAVLRRADTSTTTPKQNFYLQGDLMIDPIRRKVSIGGEKIDLTPVEFRLLAYLARRPGQVVPYSELMAQVWGTEFNHNIVSLRVHVHNLRQKIEKDPQNPQHILAKRGVGYYLTNQEA